VKIELRDTENGRVTEQSLEEAYWTAEDGRVTYFSLRPYRKNLGIFLASGGRCRRYGRPALFTTFSIADDASPVREATVVFVIAGYDRGVAFRGPAKVEVQDLGGNRHGVRLSYEGTPHVGEMLPGWGERLGIELTGTFSRDEDSCLTLLRHQHKMDRWLHCRYGRGLGD
jgi:hypothetical protein